MDINAHQKVYTQCPRGENKWLQSGDLDAALLCTTDNLRPQDRDLGGCGLQGPRATDEAAKQSQEIMYFNILGLLVCQF